PNTWHAEIYAIPDTDVSVAGPPGQLAAGDVVFKQDGSIDLSNTTLFGAAGSPAVLTLDKSGGPNPKWDDTLGIAGQTLNFALGNGPWYPPASTVNKVASDGAGVGNIIGIQVGEDGVVSALFDNAQVRKIAQVAIATVPNSNGLQPTSGNAYLATLN